MQYESDLVAILASDAVRMKALADVRAMALADGWIGAGFVRDAVWDQLHGRGPLHPAGDVDILWFDPAQSKPEIDRSLEIQLKQRCSTLLWSVKNQSRMNVRNGDAAYVCVADAMRHWPETATAVAVRLSEMGDLEINAPYGLDDLFDLRLVPTPYFVTSKHHIFQQRILQKQWLKRYPQLTLPAPRMLTRPPPAATQRP